MSSNNIPLLIKYGLRDDLANTPVTNPGIIYYCYDTNELFFDFIIGTEIVRQCLNPYITDPDYGTPAFEQGKGLINQSDKDIIDTAVRFVEQNLEPQYKWWARQNIDAVGEKTIQGGEIFNRYPSNPEDPVQADANLATGLYSHAEGDLTSAEGTGSHAEGLNTSASGNYSHAEGSSSKAKGEASHAEGSHTEATGHYSHAEGGYTKAIKNYSHTEGQGTEAQGEAAHAEGWESIASGNYSHAEGYYTQTSGDSSHAEGYYSKANGQYSHTEGNYTVANGNNSHAEGNYTIANGINSHAEGYNVIAAGAHSHAEGYSPSAGYLGLIGEINTTTYRVSFFNPWEAFNVGNILVYDKKIAKIVASNSGTKEITVSSSLNTDQEWNGVRVEAYSGGALGHCSHSEGNYTLTNGNYSHAEGTGTIASGENQHVQGKYNIEDTENKFAHIVGNGSSTIRSNAHTLDWNGNTWFAGDVYIGGTSMEDATKLEIAKPYMTKITLTTAGWDTTTLTQAALIEGIKADETAQAIYINPVFNNTIIEEIGNCNVYASAQGENNITFSCDNIPTIDVEFYVKWQDVTWIQA